MPEYVLNRNHTLRSVNGVVSFVKGEPVWVPPVLEKEALMIGAERVDGDAPSLLDPETPKAPEVSPDERRAQVFIAFDMLIEKNDAKDFTAQGVPTVKAVERIVDFSLERGEIVEFWSEHKRSKAEGL